MAGHYGFHCPSINAETAMDEEKDAKGESPVAMVNE
ncbi:hypothetical protein J2Y67_001777 [Neobacillus niacini]|nr:hypothetical protein [Neobacillus niacini]